MKTDDGTPVEVRVVDELGYVDVDQCSIVLRVTDGVYESASKQCEGAVTWIATSLDNGVPVGLCDFHKNVADESFDNIRFTPVRRTR
jgi:hypothetical protein